MDIKKVQEIKETIANCEIESAKAKGVIESIEADWEKEFGTKDINVVKEKLAEMEDELKTSDSRMEKLYNDLLNSYDWDKLEEELKA